MSRLHLALSLSLSLLAACAPANSSPVAPANSAPATETAEAPHVLEAQRALVAYEAVRAALASDSFADVGPAARTLGSATGKARDTAPESWHASLDALASAAPPLAEAADLDAARVAFGEVSRAVVTLLASDPGLASGRPVFTCPMAPGYPKWVQTTEAIDNPYMGRRMPTCGMASDLSP